MALVQVGDHGLGQERRFRPGAWFGDIGQLLGDDGLLRDQNGDRGALGLVVLVGDVEDVGPDDVGHVGQNGGQPGRVVGLVDVTDIGLALGLGIRVADIVDVEAQGLGQVVEALKLELLETDRHNEGLLYAQPRILAPPLPGRQPLPQPTGGRGSAPKTTVLARCQRACSKA